MPTLSDLGLEADLRSTPWRYPGPKALTSGVLIGDRYSALTPLRSRRLGQARVAIVPGEDDERCSELPLNFVLLKNNVPAPDSRTLVVAIGSNASPGVMHRKLSRLGARQVLPMVRGTLDGVGLAHSAHVSDAGYIAAAPYSDPLSRLDVVAALLDQEQLQCLDETEPNYVRRTGTSGLTLEGGEQPSTFHLYTSVWGVLGSPGQPPIPFGDQDRLLAQLADLWPELGERISRRTGLAGEELRDARAVTTALSENVGARDEIRDLCAVSGWARDSALDDLPADAQPVVYGRTSTGWGRGTGDHDSLEALGTADTLDRRGEPCIILNARDAQQRGIDSHALVRSATASAGLVARLVIDDQQPAGTAGLDQVVRNALGVELRERVDLAEARPERNAVADFVITRPHFVVCRVQTADLATVEQPVCLLDPLAMSILGVDSGDEVVIEGVTSPSGRVRTVRLKAHEVPDDVRERRQTLGGGQLDARFPSARDALAVYPDLPWIFLDSAARARLGLDAKLAPVRVRASRRYQWSEELRELLLLLVIAFIGLASLIDSVAVLVSALVGISLLTLVLIRSRVRLRLRSQMDGSPPG